MYYSHTRAYLSKIVHCFDCDGVSGSCDNESHCIAIEVWYNELVHSLMLAAEHTIPKIPHSALKHYWSAA